MKRYEVETVQAEQTEQDQDARVRQLDHVHGPRLPLVMAGALLVAAVATLAATGDLRAAPLTAILTLETAFAAYAVVCWRLHKLPARSARHTTVGIVAGAIGLRAIMLVAPPSLSDDIYRYRWDGLVQAAGLNPYAHAPADPEVRDLRDREWESINYPEIRTIYPPLAQAIFSLTYWLHESVKAFQIVATVGDLLVIFLLMAILAALRAPPWQLALYALHPLPIVEFSGSGHFDAWVIAASLAAVLAYLRGAALAATVLIGAGILLKSWPLILVPLFLRHRARWHYVVLLGLVGGALALYWDPGMLQPWREYTTRWRFNDGFFWLLHAGTGSLLRSKVAAAGIGAALLASMWRHRIDPLAGSYWLLIGFIVLMPTVHPWYMLWALPLAAAARDLGWITLCGLAPLAYAILLGAGPDSNTWIEPLWPRFVEYGAGATIWAWQWRRCGAAPAPRALPAATVTIRSA